MNKKNITILGAGITGLWQALLLARSGHQVTLVEKSTEPFVDSASLYAGAMLAPHCETESADPLIARLGLEALPLWKQHYPALSDHGSLVVARPRDTAELKRFARQTTDHTRLDHSKLADFEPDLAEHYDQALYFADEAHIDPHHALPYLLDEIEKAGATVRFGTAHDTSEISKADWILNCTGMGAKEKLTGLRGVRGERALVKTKEIALCRAIHLLHPRFPIYVVPWPGNRYMIGATVIESESTTPVTIRSALELLSAAYALHPAFAEAEIVSFDVGVRPAFPDNLPKIVVQGTTLYVNGLFRNGFLLAPTLAKLTCHFIETGERREEKIFEDFVER